MNREIKFRAWDKIGKRMNAVRMVDWSEGEMHNGGDVLKLADIELMQYTGLKDKNGKEVYVGDIIKQEGNDWGEIFQVPEFDFLNGWAKLALSEPFEVIGNCYESPSILNPKE